MDTIPENIVLDFLEEHGDFVEGVCITGGEPMLQPGLPNFCRKVHDKRKLVKLDTNGTNPEVLKKLVLDGLVDYVAMDVKAPLDGEKYAEAAGVDVESLLEKIKESINFLLSGTVDYEFRTTVVPGIHTKEDIERIAENITGAKKYALQKFESGKCLDPAFDELKMQRDEVMNELVEVSKKHVQNVKWRGRKLG